MDEAFSDNWAYLRTELNWLDRVLAGAIARQRKETKEVDRVSKARIDQITSHWWKGLIQVDQAIAGDSPAEVPRRSGTKVNYQQQLEARIQSSHRQGIVLGLPSLCQRLELSQFEKNLILLALAPEVSRRYGRIYNFLQETDHAGASGLPTIDLILRLLCRNDTEWRTARLSLSNQAKLLRHQVVVLPQSATESFLSHPVKLADAIAEYLLADMPELAMLEQLLQPAGMTAETRQQANFNVNSRSNADSGSPEQPIALLPAKTGGTAEPLPASWDPAQIAGDAPVASAAIAQLPQPFTDLWQKLILPKPLKAELQHLCDRVQFAPTVDVEWGFQHHLAPGAIAPGTIALLTGAAGTGKTLTAHAIAQSLNTPLVILDLALLESAQMESVVQDLTIQAPTVLLLKSARYWFGRLSSNSDRQISHTQLHQFLQARHSTPTITLLSAEQPGQIKAVWRSCLTITLNFPVPNKTNRLHLWQQAFPAATPLAPDIDWQELAKLPLTGGAIQAIAREAAIYARGDKVNMSHILQAHQMGHPHAK